MDQYVYNTTLASIQLCKTSLLSMISYLLRGWDGISNVKFNSLSIPLPLYPTQVFRVKPPMCVTEADALFGIDVIRSALQKHSV